MRLTQLNTVWAMASAGQVMHVPSPVIPSLLSLPLAVGCPLRSLAHLYHVSINSCCWHSVLSPVSINPIVLFIWIPRASMLLCHVPCVLLYRRISHALCTAPLARSIDQQLPPHAADIIFLLLHNLPTTYLYAVVSHALCAAPLGASSDTCAAPSACSGNWPLINLRCK